AVTKAPAMAIHITVVQPSCPRVTRTSSFDQKPASGKMPARARDPMTNVQELVGMCFFRPPMPDMLSEWGAWTSEAAPRPRRALKEARATRGNTPDGHAPAATGYV